MSCVVECSRHLSFVVTRFLCISAFCAEDSTTSSETQYDVLPFVGLVRVQRSSVLFSLSFCGAFACSICPSFSLSLLHQPQLQSPIPTSSADAEEEVHQLYRTTESPYAILPAKQLKVQKQENSAISGKVKEIVAFRSNDGVDQPSQKDRELFRKIKEIIMDRPFECDEGVGSLFITKTSSS